MSFAKAFELAERFVVAVEKIAGAVIVIESGKTSDETPVSGPGYAPPETVEHPGILDTGAVVDREAIKRQLRERGIKFKDAARTESLQKLLENARGEAIEKLREEDRAERLKMTEQEIAASLPGESLLPVGMAAPSKDQVRDALVGLSAAKGKDKALNVLKTVGKAEKLSDVAENLYAAVIMACGREKTNV